VRILSLKLGVLSGLLATALTLLANSASATDQLFVKIPLGIPGDLWTYFIPKDNRLTPAKIELGRQLFFDPRLSADGSISCASCHNPKFAFTDGRKTAEGIGRRHGARNTPTLLNAMFSSTLFWDGRADSLEQQALQPLVDENEMGNRSHQQVVQLLAGIPEYAAQFQAVFGGPVSVDSLAKAIASFERTLVSANSPFDRFQQGDRGAMSEQAQRGLVLFRTKARCSVCHSVNQSFPFFTDGNYRNTGVAASVELVLNRDESKPELGRFLVTRSSVDVGAFRTASLRNIELTAPYFHDGSAATLSDVIRYYMRGGNQNGMHDWELQAISLTEVEQTDLIEFLRALTSDEARKEAIGSRQ
jgi:cytochrome c peroxidase